MKAIIFSKIDDEEIIRLRNELYLESTDKLGLHLTWNALELDEENKSSLEQTVERIPRNNFPLKIEADGVATTTYGVVRLKVVKTTRIQILHESVVIQTSKFRNSKLPSKALEYYNTLSDGEKRLVELYGRANVMNRFQPHISLGRTSHQIVAPLCRMLTLDNIEVYTES